MNRAELALVLRQARSRISPGDVGLPEDAAASWDCAARRSPSWPGSASTTSCGWSRAAGPRPSASVLTALVRALRLDRDERDQLFRLAGEAPPLSGRITDHVRPSVLRLLDRFTDLPAIVLDAKSDVLAWNDMATALLGDFSTWTGGRRNIVWQRFMGVRAGWHRHPKSRPRRRCSRWPACVRPCLAIPMTRA